LIPVVACVGLKAQRINAVVAALGGERVDVVPWSDAPDRFVKFALVPARVHSVEVDWPQHRAVAIVSKDQLDLARGADGDNEALASQLTGWTVNVVTHDAV
jgi:N utilization substance protein A